MTEAAIIVVSICVLTTILTIIGVVYSARENERRRLHALEIKRLDDATKQTLSLDQMRRSEIQLEQQKLERETNGEQK